MERNIGVIEIKDLVGYDQSDSIISPVWGDSVGIYDAKTGKLNGQSVGEGVRVQAESLFTELELYAQLSNVCNMVCPDCAVGLDEIKDHDSIEWMSDEVLEKGIRGIVDSAIKTDRKSVKIKFAGGETMLKRSMDPIDRQQKTIKEIKTRYSQLEINQVVITNGTLLTPENVKKLKEWDAYVSVSLWGIGERNDTERKSKVGGSYNKVVEGLERLFEAEVEFGVHHVISPSNAPYFDDFIRTLGDPESDNYPAKNWNWARKPQPLPITIQIKRPQSPASSNLYQAEIPNMISGIRKGAEVVLDLLNRGYKVSYLHRLDFFQPFEIKMTTCGSGFNYIAIGPKGQVAGCHEALRFTKSTIDSLSSQLSLLEMANKYYSGSQEKLHGLGLDFGETADNTLIALALHGGGGCPILSRMENKGEMGHAANFTQQIYEALLPDMLALEVKRQKMN